MIIDFINEICDLLHISTPNISNDTSVFASKTQMACYDPGTNTIHIPDKEPDPDLHFAIAHELRHIWQTKYHSDIYFVEYTPRDNVDDVINYNNQIAEIDANAFATLVMMSMFHLRPRFDGMPVNMINAIYNRADTIYHEEFEK